MINLTVAGINLVEHIECENAGTAMGNFAAELCSEIEADRQELEGLMAPIGVTESHARKAAAWLSEQVSEIKLRVDDLRDGSLHQLESLDTLSLGIEGKRLMWRSLYAASEGQPELAGPDYAILQRRADGQRDRVEMFRLGAAKAALEREWLGNC